MNAFPYLMFNGNCLEAAQHYARVLNGRVFNVTRASTAPMDCLGPDGKDWVMNLSLKFGDSLLMASDCPAGMYEAPRGFRVCVVPDSLAEFERIHAALSEQALSVEMPANETFWADRFAMFTDRYGTPWMLNFLGTKAATTEVPAD